MNKIVQDLKMEIEAIKKTNREFWRWKNLGTRRGNIPTEYKNLGGKRYDEEIDTWVEENVKSKKF